MKKVRLAATGYVIVGFSYFLLWHYILTPADKANPLLQILFYVFLPAALVLPYLIIEVAGEVFTGKEDDTEQNIP